MSRPLRIDLPDGWYHVTARGNERKAIFRDDRDRRHFLDLLQELAQRFGVRVHGYVLMDNHYHLLLQTPRANLSRAMQWLGVSYSGWFNRRHERSGHLFQGRFKAIVLEAETGVLEVSRYLHINPVRIGALGLGKQAQQRQQAGLGDKPQPKLVRERIGRLRRHRWSSYRAYAGWAEAPRWLTVRTVLAMGGGRSLPEQRQAYRQYVEEAAREGLEESPWERVEAGVVLGTAEFVRRLRPRLRGNRREQAGLNRLAGVRAFAEVVAVVEKLKGEPWEAFRDRHGDWGRDLAVWLARRHCGMKLRELGQAVGGVDYATVSSATRRLERRAQHDRKLASALNQAEVQLQNAKM